MVIKRFLFPFHPETLVSLLSVTKLYVFFSVCVLNTFISSTTDILLIPLIHCCFLANIYFLNVLFPTMRAHYTAGGTSCVIVPSETFSALGSTCSVSVFKAGGLNAAMPVSIPMLAALGSPSVPSTAGG